MKQKKDPLLDGKFNKSYDSVEHLKNMPIDSLTTRDWRIFRENHEIQVKGQMVPNPIRKWQDLDETIPGEILQNIKRLGYEMPTGIQMQAISAG